VTLKCLVRSENILWEFAAEGKKTPITIVEGCKTEEMYSNSYRVKMSNTACNLVIDNLTLAMAGTYTCTDRKDGSTSVSTEYNVTVDDKVKVNSDAVFVGKSVTLKSVGQSQNIRWEFVAEGSTTTIVIVKDCQPETMHSNSYRVDKSNNSCNLIIESLTLATSGTYTCIDSKHGASPLSTEYIVTVDHQMKHENAVDLVGKPVTLKCLGQSQHISWEFVAEESTTHIVIVKDCHPDAKHIDNYRVDKSNTSCNLIIEKVNLAMAGTYTCIDTSHELYKASITLFVYDNHNPQKCCACIEDSKEVTTLTKKLT